VGVCWPNIDQAASDVRPRKGRLNVDLLHTEKYGAFSRVPCHVEKPPLEIRNARYAMCDPLRKKTRDLFDITVFPGDAIPQGEGIGMSRNEIDTAMVKRNATPFSHAGYISQVLIACVDYQLSFTSKHHQTWYAFMLGVPNPDGSYMADFRPEGTPADLRLIFWGQSAD
jgi:hypothetical protein